MDRITKLALVTAALALAALSGETHAETHVYEVVEVTLNADNTYSLFSAANATPSRILITRMWS